MSESKFQSKLRDKLVAAGWYVLKLGLTNKNGIPDLLCLKTIGGDHLIMFVEVKDEDKRADPLQAYRRKELRALGFLSYVIDPDTPDYEEILNI